MIGWLQRVFSRPGPQVRPKLLDDVQLIATGWEEQEEREAIRTWRNSQGAVLTLTVVGAAAMTLPSDLVALRSQCRDVAERKRGGLVEANILDTAFGSSVWLIYKQLQRPAFIFTGMLWMPVAGQWLIWATVDGERGTTGAREAAITARLFNAGELTVDAYQESWARDPYDRTYNRVDRSTLRYVSDDDKYDADFPFHPLSKVRRTLRQISAAESIQSFHVY